MDGKCAAAPPFPYPLSFTWKAHLPSTTGPATTPVLRDKPASGRDGGRVKQWKNVLTLLINNAALPGES